MERNEPCVGIIVLNYKNYNDTFECLESIKKLRYTNFIVITIDNGSENESNNELMKWHQLANDNFFYIGLKYNNGYAAGNNYGIKIAKEKGCDYFWILNNDTIVTPESLTKLVEKMMITPKLGLCGSKLIYDWNKRIIQGYGAYYNKYTGLSENIDDIKKINKMNMVLGASVFISKDFIEDVGYMCEDYFLYFEEIDWAMRARGKYKIGCATESVVYHKEGSVIGASGRSKNNKSILSDYYLIRNRILITKKFFKKYIITVYLGLVFAIFNRLRRKQYDRVWMIIRLMCTQEKGKHEFNT